VSLTVGIDLGTTNSLVAYVRDGVPVVIRDRDGAALLPSIVSVLPDGGLLVGRDAQRQLSTSPERTAYSVKRLMGKGPADVAADAALLPFPLTGGPAGDAAASGIVRVRLGDREFTPHEISAVILRELKARAEAHFAEQGVPDPRVTRAVITVPAYFNDAQRTATRDAGRLAGLEVLRIINEPTAASLAYGLDKRRTGTIAVYDLGGGTFDISILTVEDGVFQVLSTNGDTHLGGDDIDSLLTRVVLETFEQNGLVVQRKGAFDAAIVQAIRKGVIQAKHDLSTQPESAIVVDGFAVRGSGRIEPAPGGVYRMNLTRTEFESYARSIVDRTLAPCRAALADAGIKPQQVDEVVLVGGSTRIPLLRRLVGELFGRAPHTELDPDEVVALGAAVQADILATGKRDMLLLDVTPLSLGIETLGGLTSRIVLRNSTIPATGSETFTTGVDNQTAVDIHVVQGERDLVADNRSLARFRLRGIPPMPAGLPRVEVTFQIDADGILAVKAREARTSVEQHVTVTPSYGLSEDEIEQMLLDSLEHAADDQGARLLIEARQEAESVIAATEKTLRAPDFEAIAGELEPGELPRITSIVAGLKMVMNAPDREAIQKWTRALNDATRHLAELAINRSVQAALAGKRIDDA
jgi:molecular chaperone DnaK